MLCSYFAQCAFTLIAWLSFILLDLGEHHRILSKGSEQKEILITGLTEFHKAQCFFSIALQIASLFAGIFRSNIMNAYMLLPVSTNGIVPVLLTFVLLVRYGRASIYLAILTGIDWVLATVVFWGIYAHVDFVELGKSSLSDPRDQFYEQLSNHPACGGYSAQTVCEVKGFDNDPFGTAKTSFRYTPFVWSWCSLYLLLLTGHILMRETTIGTRCKSRILDLLDKVRWLTLRLRHESRRHYNSGLLGVITFWVTTSTLVALLGFQFYLFRAAVEVGIINSHNWGFGQIIGITIWSQPVMEYLYLQFRKSNVLRSISDC